MWSWPSEGVCDLFFQLIFVVRFEEQVLVIANIFCERPVAGRKVIVHMERS